MLLEGGALSIQLKLALAIILYSSSFFTLLEWGVVGLGS
jgi:hypothetical protein